MRAAPSLPKIRGMGGFWPRASAWALRQRAAAAFDRAWDVQVLLLMITYAVQLACLGSMNFQPVPGCRANRGGLLRARRYLAGQDVA